MESSLLSLPPLAAILLFGRTLDLVLLFGFAIYRNWKTVQELLNFCLNLAIVSDIVKVATALFGLLQLTRYILRLKRSSSPSDKFLVKPMFFPCRTSHVRMFPTKHGFSYSYLLTGVPVGWKGSVGGMLSEDDAVEPAPWYSRLFSLNPGGAWYTVNGDDYLDRGHVEGGLKWKLKNYLQGQACIQSLHLWYGIIADITQGIDPEQYPYGYLVTAARFLGYASNPLSVWYLYSSTKELTALILEVNNTFDERRIYFLEPSHTDANSNEPSKPTRYTGTWAKDFYVSVFNTREGSYSLAASDPFFPHLTGTGPINSTVTLSSPEGHAKLIARIYSADEAVNPATLSIWQKTEFLASWWWVGLATFPRTIQQALVILLRVKLPWVFRPEPRRETIARRADDTELCIEKIFRAYLREIVENAEGRVRVRYIPAGLLDVSEEAVMSSSVQPVEDQVELEIRVLTPIFYSRVVQYPDLLDGILSEYQDSLTVSLSSTVLFSKLGFDGHASSPNGLWETLSFKAIFALRRRLAPIFCLDELKTSPPRNPVPSTALSNEPTGLDAFVLHHSPLVERKEYASRVLKLLITGYVAFGWVEILDLEMFVARSLALWIVAGVVFW